ncbi:MAG: DUF86 domain-containing protein [Thermodesulfobacteriota bacterium]
MPRDYRLYLDDILESCRRVRQYTDGISLEEFRTDLKTQDAVTRNFEKIGEAAKHLPDHIKAEYRGIEWKKITAFRNVLIHEYFGIKVETLWDVVKEKIPALEEQTKTILSEHT